MEQLDQEFTNQLQQWLETPAAERDLTAGAALFHRLRPQERTLYRAFLIRPQVHAERLEYELTKHLRIRLEGFTLRQVAVMNKTVVPQVGAVLTAGFKGRRKDHEKLPADIQKLYDDNGVIYEKMKSLYNTLLGMESAPACDRFEHLNPLRLLDNEYRSNWEKYDSYVLESETPEDGQEPVPAAAPSEAVAHSQQTDEEDADVAEPTAKEVSAARKFISTNLHKLETEEKDEKRRNEMVQAIYERVRTIDDSGGTFKPDMAERLRVVGIEV